MQIVLAEDNPGDVTLVKVAMADTGVAHRFIVLTDGEQAIDFFNCVGNVPEPVFPDFVMLDLNLPKRNGFQILAAIRSKPQLASIPVIILSSSDNELDIAHAYELRANAYVVKSSDLESTLKTFKGMAFWYHTVFVANDRLLH